MVLSQFGPCNNIYFNSCTFSVRFITNEALCKLVMRSLTWVLKNVAPTWLHSKSDIHAHNIYE